MKSTSCRRKRDTERERRDLEAIDGEEAAENALLEAGAEDDDIVLLIHGREVEGSERRRKRRLRRPFLSVGVVKGANWF